MARNPMLLLVEDDEHLAELIMLYLWSDDAKLQIKHAVNMRDAKEMMAGTTFDLLISDYDLPDGNGLEVVQAFRKLQCSVPAIMMSARNDPVFCDNVAQAGVIQLFHKPLCLSALQATVCNLVLP